MSSIQLTIDGREERREAPENAQQLGLLEVPPASTFAGDYGNAPDSLETLPLAESMRAPHRVRRSR
jgi:hypothetical protein